MTSSAIKGQLILEEDYDESYEPSEQEIKDYAINIGIDPVNEPQLLWVAMESIVAPLPAGWRTCQNMLGRRFYFNSVTGHFSIIHPRDEEHRGLVVQERAHLMAAGGVPGVCESEQAEQAKPAVEQAERELEQARRELEQAEQAKPAVELKEPAVEQAERELEQARQELEQAEQAKPAVELKEPAVEQAERELEQAERELEEVGRDLEQAERELEQAKQEAEQAKQEVEQAQRAWPTGAPEEAGL